MIGKINLAWDSGLHYCKDTPNFQECLAQNREYRHKDRKLALPIAYTNFTCFQKSPNYSKRKGGKMIFRSIFYELCVLKGSTPSKVKNEHSVLKSLSFLGSLKQFNTS